MRRRIKLIAHVLWRGIKAELRIPSPSSVEQHQPPAWIEIPAFLRRHGPLLSQSQARYDELLDKHERLAAADGMRVAAARVYDITRSRWLAEQLEALADATAAGR